MLIESLHGIDVITLHDAEWCRHRQIKTTSQLGVLRLSLKLVALLSQAPLQARGDLLRLQKSLPLRGNLLVELQECSGTR